MNQATVTFPPALSRKIRDFAVARGVLSESPHSFFQERGWLFQRGLVLMAVRLGGPIVEKVTAVLLVVPEGKVEALKQLLFADGGAVEASEHSGGDS